MQSEFVLKNRKSLLFAASLCSCLVLVVVTGTYLKKTTVKATVLNPANPTTIGSTVSSPRPGQDDEKQATAFPKILRLYSTPFGIEPRNVRIAPGNTIVVIRNRTGESSLSFNFNRINQGAATVATIRLTDGESSFVPLTLTSGEYQVSEAQFPQLRCSITVTAQ